MFEINEARHFKFHVLINTAEEYYCMDNRFTPKGDVLMVT